ncbi:unnamed protein product [Paramecium sonneborni]|uniref:Transmembrane protein n=1 Tax=Paramecium sonneborni TaxID=65129 RepID=A0A8S1MR25_9CILI|nr:unnamed protein product [Paramecium sonneborni]
MLIQNDNIINIITRQKFKGGRKSLTSSQNNRTHLLLFTMLSIKWALFLVIFGNFFFYILLGQFLERKVERYKKSKHVQDKIYSYMNLMLNSKLVQFWGLLLVEQSDKQRTTNNQRRKK